MPGNSAKKRILLISQSPEVTTDGCPDGVHVDTFSDAAAALRACSETHYDLAAVSMSISGNLKKLLMSLRENGNAGKIVLLARIYEEPFAIELLQHRFDRASLADDYLLCPLNLAALCKNLIQGYDDVILDEHKDEDKEKYNLLDKLRILEKLSVTDELTGLRNRRYLWEFCRQVIERAQGCNGQVTVLIFDIDYFKHYNDVYSHSVGDEILRQIAKLMQSSCRAHDIVGRLGGDEFVVIFWYEPELKEGDSETERRTVKAEHPREVIGVAKRFQRALKMTKFPLLGPEGKGMLTISGGLAGYPKDGMTVDELFEQADKALLDAKRSGKNRIYLVGQAKNDISEL